MRDEKVIQQQAKAALIKHLEKLHCAVVAEKQGSTTGECLVIQSLGGSQHDILIRLLNLDKERSVFLHQRDFDYQLRDNLWILLVLYMQDMEPLLYLIPSTVFASTNRIFISNEQPPMFRHLSNWEIKIFTNAIPELSLYALDTVMDLDRP